ncbi:MAG: MBL fold metallo-hydrolase [Methanobacteriaceae archaeon]|nr:MBL fold metallo-hydrolase [Methanobacteriaceae archaeon]
MYEKIKDSLYKIKTERPSCTSYLIIDQQKILLIDPGLYQKYPILKKELNNIGIKPEDIDMVINTHEHADHMGANKYFQNTATIMTHRYAATKIIYADEEVLHCRGHGHDPRGYNVHLWLENNNVLELDDWFLKILYTPGHTSGSLCVYEPRKRILFSGDTVFSKGTISKISDSGSYGEYINSLSRLNTLKINQLLPGHGSVSNDVEEDIQKALINAKSRHEEFLNIE